MVLKATRAHFRLVQPPLLSIVIGVPLAAGWRLFGVDESRRNGRSFVSGDARTGFLLPVRSSLAAE